MTSVVIEQRFFGTTEVTMATADVFTADELTVSCSDPEYDAAYGPMRVFRSGTWNNATVLDDHGNVLFGFTSPSWLAQLEQRIDTDRVASR